MTQPLNNIPDIRESAGRWTVNAILNHCNIFQIKSMRNSNVNFLGVYWQTELFGRAVLTYFTG